MDLKFICSEDFEIAEEICSKVQGYLPNLISNVEIIRSDSFKGIFETWDIVPMVERVAEPDWQSDIILVVIYGSLYFTDIELSEAVGCTLDYLPLQGDGTPKPFLKMPKLGAQLLPRNMSEEPRWDADYWAKLGVEELLHYFAIPEQHDENCFFHSKEFGKATVEDCRRNYCPKCLKFMRQLKEPLNFTTLFARMEKIYDLKSKRRWKGIFK